MSQTTLDSAIDDQISGAAKSRPQVIPKFCTAVNLAVLEDNRIILSLLYTEGFKAELIETIMIDMEHAKELHKTLGTIINDMEKYNEDKKKAENSKKRSSWRFLS